MHKFCKVLVKNTYLYPLELFKTCGPEPRTRDPTVSKIATELLSFTSIYLDFAFYQVLGFTSYFLIHLDKTNRKISTKYDQKLKHCLLKTKIDQNVTKTLFIYFVFQ